MIDTHTDTRTHTHTDYFLACKLHWSGELQRPDGLVSTSDISTGQLINPFKNNQTIANCYIRYILLQGWTYTFTTPSDQRPRQIVMLFFRYLNLKKPKKSKEHPIIYHPFHSSNGFAKTYKKSAQTVKPFLRYCNLKNRTIWLIDDTVLNCGYT